MLFNEAFHDLNVLTQLWWEQAVTVKKSQNMLIGIVVTHMTGVILVYDKLLIKIIPNP